jgi:hypothetical protein
MPQRQDEASRYEAKMIINKTNVAVQEIDAEHGRVVGRVTFFYGHSEDGDQGTANFLCSAPLEEEATRGKVWGALVREACRQVSRMPEYLLGQRNLSFAKDVILG